MSLHEDEVSELKKINNELVQKVQYWKMLAGQRENEKLNLMKEINELRLQLSRLRSNGRVQASNLDAALQSACEKALSYLVVASGEITRSVELTKAYMRHREELDNISPRWSSIGGTPQSVKKNKVHRVPPLMMGGQSIQPVVALTMLNTSIPRTTARSPDQNRSGTDRALPLHMLQDVYIPLTRIDADLHVQNMETDNVDNADDRSEQSQIDDDDEVLEGSQRISDLNSAREMYAVDEESEPDNDEIVVPRSRVDNPLEGPSWMLDGGINNTAVSNGSKVGSNLEPDSTTEMEVYGNTPPAAGAVNTATTSQHLAVPPRTPRAFSPTVRRRKRAPSPPRSPPAPAAPAADLCSPRPAANRRLSNSGRVLKVLVAKMRLDGDVPRVLTTAVEGSPVRRASAAAATSAFDAPSPNGATIPGLIVSETSQDELESLGSGESAAPRRKHKSHHGSNTEHHSSADNTTNHRASDPDEPRAKSRSIDKESYKQSHREGNVTHRQRHRTNSGEHSNSAERSDRQGNDVERFDRQGNESERSDRQGNDVQRSDRQENDAEHSARQVNSVDLSMERHERHRQVSVRNRSAERNCDIDLWTDSHASNDSEVQQDSGAAACEERGSRGRLVSCESDSSEAERSDARTRRIRKLVTYKEKPLNRKMRR